MKVGSDRFLVRDISFQVTGNVTAQLLGIATMPILTRIYAPDQFAALSIFMAVVAFFNILVTVRLEYLVVQVACDEDVSTLFAMIVRYGLIISVISTLCLYLLADTGFLTRLTGSLGSLVVLAPLSAWLLSLSVAFAQVRQREGDFFSTGVSEVTGRLGYLGVAMAGGAVLPGATGLILTSLGNSVSRLSCFFYLHRNLSRYLFAATHRKIPWRTLRMGGSLSASGLFNVVAGSIPIIYITSNFGPTALGFYGLVASTLFLPTSLIGIGMGQVFYQRAAKAHNDNQPFIRLILLISLPLLLIAAAFFILVLFFADFLYGFVFGPNWAGASDVAVLMVGAAALGFVAAPFDRTSAIVGAWRYPIINQAARVLGVSIVVLLAEFYSLTFNEFIFWLATQAAAMYVGDWIASVLFARRRRVVASVIA